MGVKNLKICNLKLLNFCVKCICNFDVLSCFDGLCGNKGYFLSESILNLYMFF